MTEKSKEKHRGGIWDGYAKEWNFPAPPANRQMRPGPVSDSVEA
jgi:hypothetical protein